eukprot:jgi/Botrbrau1/22743/Bobra.0132s0076.1
MDRIRDMQPEVAAEVQRPVPCAVTPVVIREGTVNDIPDLVALLAELFLIEADFEPDSNKQEAGLHMLLNSPKDCILVALLGKQVCGMVSIQTLLSTAEGGQVGLLEDFIVSYSARGQGVGSALMAGALRWAEERQLKRLQLLADRHNFKALDFYRHKGWASTDLVVLRHVGSPQPPDLPESHPDTPLLGSSNCVSGYSNADADLDSLTPVDG